MSRLYLLYPCLQSDLHVLRLGRATLPQELVQSKPTSLALHEIIDPEDVIILQFESPGGPGGPVGPKMRLIIWLIKVVSNNIVLHKCLTDFRPTVCCFSIESMFYLLVLVGQLVLVVLVRLQVRLVQLVLEVHVVRRVRLGLVVREVLLVLGRHLSLVYHLCLVGLEVLLVQCLLRKNEIHFSLSVLRLLMIAAFTK